MLSVISSLYDHTTVAKAQSALWFFRHIGLGPGVFLCRVPLHAFPAGADRVPFGLCKRPCDYSRTQAEAV